jgi:hypothetical protein
VGHQEASKTDRIACPWLIRRFIDPDAEIRYVPADQVLAVAQVEAARSFDAPGAEFTHCDGQCTFEVLVAEFGLGADLALVRLASIVDAADIDGELYTDPPSPPRAGARFCPACRAEPKALGQAVPGTRVGRGRSALSLLCSSTTRSTFCLVLPARTLTIDPPHQRYLSRTTLAFRPPPDYGSTVGIRLLHSMPRRPRAARSMPVTFRW